MQLKRGMRKDARTCAANGGMGDARTCACLYSFGGQAANRGISDV